MIASPFGPTPSPSETEADAARCPHRPAPVLRCIALASVGLLAGATAIADSRIAGDLELRVTTGDVSSVAIGAGARDVIDIGSVVDSAIGGGSVRVTTGDITSVTVGPGLAGGVSVGAVLNAREGRVGIRVYTGRIVNVTGPAGGRVAIGNVGGDAQTFGSLPR